MDSKGRSSQKFQARSVRANAFRRSLRARGLHVPPLALALAFLLMPHGWDAGLGSLVPQAQAAPMPPPAGCALDPKLLLQGICDATITQKSALQTWERESVKLDLALHGIPATDANLQFFYDYAGADFRNEMRAFLYVQLAALALSNSSNLTLTQNIVLGYFTDELWAREKALYQRAVDDKNAYKLDNCNWRPDTDLASSFGFNYTPCFGNAAFHSGPTKDYFLSAAFKQQYAVPLSNLVGGLQLFKDMQKEVAIALGVGIGVGAALGAAAGAAVSIPAVGAVIAPFALTAAAEVFGGALSALAATGIGAVIAIAVAIIIITTVLIVITQNAIAELDQLDAPNNAIHASEPRLIDYMRDTTNLGQFKASTVWTMANLPDAPSTLPLPTPGAADDKLISTFSLLSDAGVTHKDWDGNTWTENIYGDWLVRSGTAPTGGALHSLALTFDYLDWNGNKFSASRMGKNFLITKGVPAATDVECKADAITGVTPSPGPNCRNYIASSFQLRDALNHNAVVSVGTPPTLLTTLDPSIGINDVGGQLFFRASGNPTPGISFNSGFSAFDLGGDGQGTGWLTLTSQATIGDYQVGVTAVNAAGSAQRTFTVHVTPGGNFPLILPSTLFEIETLGRPFRYNVRADGPRPIVFSIVPGSPISIVQNCFPVGVTFTDNGDGTGYFSGLSTARKPDVDSVCLLKATNSFGSTQKSIDLTWALPPRVTMPPNTSVTFHAGVPSTLPVQTQPGVLPATPVSITPTCVTPPAWLTITDNHDGTATFTGTPPTNLAGNPVYNLHMRLLTIGLEGFVFDLTDCTPNVAVNVDTSLVFTSPPAATFWTAFGRSFTVSTSNSAAVLTPQVPLPGGLLWFDNHDGTAAIAGVGIAGSGRDYTIPIGATSPDGSATQNLVLRINEPPSFSFDALPATIYLMSGIANTVNLSPAGYPLKDDVHIFLDDPLPAGMTFSYLGPAGTTTGAGKITGTPPVSIAGQNFSVRIRATNSAGGTNRTLTFVVLKPGDVDHDGVTACPDVNMVKAAIGAKPGDPRYNSSVDVNGDLIVDIRDLAFITSKLATGTKCP